MCTTRLVLCCRVLPCIVLYGRHTGAKQLRACVRYGGGGDQLARNSTTAVARIQSSAGPERSFRITSSGTQICTPGPHPLVQQMHTHPRIQTPPFPAHDRQTDRQTDRPPRPSDGPAHSLQGSPPNTQQISRLVLGQFGPLFFPAANRI